MSRTAKWLIACASLLLLVGVQLGALGAHALDGVLDARGKSSWELAVQYQLVHGLGVVLLALLRERTGPSRLLASAAGLMLAGIVLFSGSIYLSALNVVSFAAQVAPFGGTAFMLAWLLTAIAAFRA